MPSEQSSCTACTADERPEQTCQACCKPRQRGLLHRLGPVSRRQPPPYLRAPPRPMPPSCWPACGCHWLPPPPLVHHRPPLLSELLPAAGEEGEGAGPPPPPALPAPPAVLPNMRSVMALSTWLPPMPCKRSRGGGRRPCEHASLGAVRAGEGCAAQPGRAMRAVRLPTPPPPLPLVRTCMWPDPCHQRPLCCWFWSWGLQWAGKRGR